MQKESKKPGELKALQIIHRAMLSGQILFAGIAFYLNYSGNFVASLKGHDQLLQVIAIVFSFGGFFIGSSLFKKKMQQLKESSPTLKTKLAAYRSAAIIQWALLEGPVLFSVICFMLVGNYAFFALAVVFILLFAVTTPNKTKMMVLLGLSEEDISEV
jgi:hypothetical protein